VQFEDSRSVLEHIGFALSFVGLRGTMAVNEESHVRDESGYSFEGVRGDAGGMFTSQANDERC
jgi:hypothetical protein